MGFPMAHLSTCSVQAGHVESCGDFLVLMGTAPVHYSTLLLGGMIGKPWT